MKRVLNTLVAASVLCAGYQAEAATFSFSYTFENGVRVSGSFDGVANGNLVTQLSNPTVVVNSNAPFINTPEFPLSVLTASYTQNASGTWSPLPITASFDGQANNFFIAYSRDVPGQAFSYYSDRSGASAYTFDYLHTSTSFAMESSADPVAFASRWELKEVSAVPQPSTYGLLLAGLALVGWSARRRQPSKP